jgi:hypothetical protein
MAERKGARWRLLLLVLVAANVLTFTFLKVRTKPADAAAMRIQEVQINAGSVKLLGAATRGAGQAATSVTPDHVAGSACLEWGPISSADAAAADSALEKLALVPRVVRRPVVDSAGGAERFAYFVREPDTATVGQIAELQRTFPGTQINAGNCPEDVAASPRK